MKTQLTVAPMVAVALLTLSGPVLAQENSQAQLYGTLSAAVIHKTNQTGGSSAVSVRRSHLAVVSGPKDARVRVTSSRTNGHFRN